MRERRHRSIVTPDKVLKMSFIVEALIPLERLDWHTYPEIGCFGARHTWMRYTCTRNYEECLLLESSALRADRIGRLHRFTYNKISQSPNPNRRRLPCTGTIRSTLNCYCAGGDEQTGVSKRLLILCPPILEVPNRKEF